MLLRRIAYLALTSLVVACSSSPDVGDPGAAGDGENVATEGAALTTSDAISRAEQWVAVKLHYCQAIYGGRDYDSACSTYCNRMSNPAWNPYRSDCSGFVSWAWGLAAPGRVTGEFAPFQNDITKAIPASTLRPGDAVNNSEHVMLFKEWVTPGKRAVFIEEPGCSSAEPYARENTSDVTLNGTQVSVASNGMTFTAIRYNALTTPTPTTAPTTTTKPPTAATSKPGSGAPTTPGSGPESTPTNGGGGGDVGSSGATASTDEPSTGAPRAYLSGDANQGGCSTSPRDAGGRSGIAMALALATGAVIARRARRRA